MQGRVTGTVIVQFAIGRKGEVLCPEVVSGPDALRQQVLDAVRKYVYKPYVLNGQTVLVFTTASVKTSNK